MNTHINRIKELAEYGSSPTVGDNSPEIENAVREYIKSPEFASEIKKTMAMTSRSLTSLLNLFSAKVGDDDGKLETRPETRRDKSTIAKFPFNTLIKSYRFGELLDEALRRSGTELPVETWNDAGDVLHDVALDIYRTYFKTMYRAVLEPTKEFSNEERKEFVDKIIITSIIISAVWGIQATIDGIKSGESLETINNDSRIMYGKGIKMNLDKWIPIITSFNIY